MRDSRQDQNHLAVNLCFCACLAYFLWVVFSFHLSHAILPGVTKFCLFSSFLQKQVGAISMPLFSIFCGICRCSQSLWSR